MKRFVLLILLMPLFKTVVGRDTNTTPNLLTSPNPNAITARSSEHYKIIAPLAPLTKSHQTAPVAPATFSIISCSGSTFSFSVATEPVGTKYTWTFPDGTGFTGGAAQPVSQSVVSGILSNPGNDMVTATYTVTSSTNNVSTLNVLVVPFPIANPVPDQEPVCANAGTLVVNFSGPKPNTEFFWSYTSPFIGIAFFSGTPVTLLPSFPAVNNLNVMVTANMNVIPTINGCVGDPVTFKIPVKPSPTVNFIPNSVLCDGVNAPAYMPASNVTGATFTWSNNNSLIGLKPTGAGAIDAFSAINKSNVPLFATVTVSAFSNGCSGYPTSYNIVVNPIPKMDPVSNISICGALSPTVTFQSPGYSGVDYIWTNSITANGLPASGNGQISSYIANNFSNVPVSSEFTVRPVFMGCVGLPVTFTMEVRPTPKVNNPGNATYCAGTLIGPINFTGSFIDGTEYNWQHTDTRIGLGATGVGSIAAFTASNGGINIPIISNFTVTPFSNSCYGPTINFSIRVNPIPNVLQVADQSNCEYLTTTPVIFSGLVPGTIFNWTNSNSAIGLSNNGTGNIGTFTYGNPTPSDITGVIIVTPISNSCSGTPMSYSYTAKAAPDMAQPASQIKCNGLITDAIPFVSTTMAGAIFSWTRTNISIGSIATSGSGNIDPFTTNNAGQNIPVQAIFTVTPFSNTCFGIPKTFSITVNPIPNVTVVPSGSVVLCSGFSTTILFTGSSVANTQFQWTNDNILSGVASSGSGTQISFTSTNFSAVPIISNFVVTPISNSCSGTPVSFSICVKPTPTINPVSSILVCSGAITNAVTFTGSIVGGTQYNWSHTTATIGLAALTGTGNIASFTTTNIYNVPISSQFTVTPFSNGCSGSTRNFSIGVNPTPNISMISDRVVCTGVSINIPLQGSSVANTTYNWINDNSAIGLASSGSGSTLLFNSANLSNVPISGKITVTPVSNSCNGIPAIFSMVVNPAVSVNTVTSQIRCNGTLTNDIIFSGSSVANTVYSWTQSTNLIGLPDLSGTGNIGAFTTNAVSNLPIMSVFTVTPMSNTCSGVSRTFSILVNPIPSVNPTANVTYCNGTAAAIIFTGSTVPGTQYQWTNTRTEIGLAANGTNANNPFIATNSSNIPITANILVTPISNSCSGTPNAFTITVNPSPVVLTVPDQAVCNGNLVQGINFVGSSISGTIYQWVRTNVPIGAVPLSGTGNISSFTGENVGNVPLTSIFTVTPFSNGCSGIAQTFSITVNPIPNIDPIPGIIKCAGMPSGLIPFTGFAMTNTQFIWSNSNVAIGLPASGTGNINSFITTNSNSVAISATFTVTPFSNSCSGIPATFQIVVKPTPSIIPLSSTEVCNSSLVPGVVFTGSAITSTSYLWKNSDASIGLSSSGTGSILPFTGTNIGIIPIISTIQVNAIANGCSSLTQTFTIRVNPTPAVNIVASQTVCGNSTVTIANFSGSNVPSTVYNWTNNNPAIGIAASGSGNINSFTALNNFFVPITANITVTPVSNSCSGASTQFTLLINPTPSVNAINSQEVCKGTFINPISITGSGVGNTQYNWSNSNPAIGLASTTGTGTIPGFTSTNNASIPISALITVTPVSNSCSGIPVQFNLRVNPIPSVASVSDILICGTQTIGPIIFTGNPSIGYVTVPGTVYNWMNSNSDIGLPLTGSGSLSAFSATNLNNIPVTGLITVTPVSNTCFGTPISFSIQIRPKPTVEIISSQSVCTNIITQPVIFSGSTITNTQYNWTNSNPAIGLASSTGTGNIPAFTATNLSNAPLTGIITVTPFTNSCFGTPMVFNYTVNPIPAVNTLPNLTVCGNTTTGPIVFTGSPLGGTVFEWTNSNVNIGLPASGIGNIQAFTISNYNNIPITAQITVTPVSNTCYGLPTSFSILLIPSPTVNPVGNQALCTNIPTAGIVFEGSTVPGTEYRWTQSNTAVGLAAVSGVGNITSFTAANNSNIPITSTFIVRAYSNTCFGAPETFTIRVNPIPAVNQMADLVICGDNNSNPIIFSGSPLGGTLYQWTNNNPQIGLASNGIGNITAFTATNFFNTNISALITVTPFSNSCAGIPTQFSILIKPTPSISLVPNQVLCTQLVTNPVFFSGSTIAGTQYQWTQSNPAVGLAALTGVNMVPAFTTTNLSNISISSKFTVTPFTNGCFGNPSIFYITVDPIPRLDPVNSQIVCGARATDPINFTGSPIGGTVFNWTNNNTAIGLPESGTGNISSFITNNNSTIPISAEIRVTPFSNTCYGTTVSFNILVKPTPGIDTITSQVLCANTSTLPINLIGSVLGGTQYNWTNSNPDIGLPVSGSGNIASFIVNNTYNIPISALLTANAFTNGCLSNPISFSIKVNPIPSMYGLTNLVYCSGETVNEIIFSGSTMAGTQYQWTNNNSLTGLANSGIGNIPAFSATNISNIPISSLIKVTPISNACEGVPANMVILIKPTPTIDTVSNKLYCINTATQPIIFSGSKIGNTQYNWTQTNNVIGLNPMSGVGNIPSFTTQNASNVPVKSLITVTPFTNGCNGVPAIFDIVVSPIPSVNSVADITVCGNQTIAPIIFSGSAVSGTEYRWTNDNTASGIAASGVGNISGITATGNFKVPIVSHISVTAFSNNCSGNTISFTLTIKPTPSIDSITSQIVCANTTVQPIVFTGSPVQGTQYQWTNTYAGIGVGTLSGNGNINTFTAANPGFVPITSQFTVTPFSNGCYGLPAQFAITVNPIPSVSSISDIIQCGLLSTNPIIFQGSPVLGTIYQWTNNNTQIGIGANGTGNIAPFSATNNTNFPLSALITVTPYSNNCSGAPKQFNVIIKSTPNIDTVANQIICAGGISQAVIFSGSKVSNTQYNWISSYGTNGGLSATSGTGNIPAFSSVNITNATIINSIQVTPFSNGCNGAAINFAYIIHPIPKINPVNSREICGSAITTPIIFNGSNVAGTVYEWSNSNPNIGLAINGVGNIPSFTPTNSINNPIATSIFVTPVANSCSGQSIGFSIVIKPIPTIDSIYSQAICNNFNTQAINFNSSILNTTYTWTNNNSGLGLPFLNGSGNISSFKGINTGILPSSMNFSVLPQANGCNGPVRSFSITVNPTPVLSSSLLPTGICNNSVFSYAAESATPGTSFIWQRFTNPVINGNTSSGGITGNIYELLNSTNTVSTAVVYAISLTANGCSQSQTVSVSVTPSPVLSSATTIPPICSGSIFNYSIQTATPGTLISWSRAAIPGITNPPSSGNNIISEILTNNSFSAKTVTYQITLTTLGCSNSQSITVTVLPLPTVIAQNLSSCSGGNIIFTPTNTADSTSLTWDMPLIVPTGSISGSQSMMVGKKSFSQQLINNTTQVAYAIYNVKTAAIGCAGNSFSITVQVLPTPVISSATLTSICSGTQFTYVPPGGVSTDTKYSWSVPEQIPRNSLSGATAGINQPIFAQTLTALNLIKDTAIYTIQAVTGNCVGTSFTLTVYIQPTPFVNTITDTVCSGVRYNLIPENVPAGTLFTWTIPQINPLGSVLGTTPQTLPVSIFSQQPVNMGTQFATLVYQATAINQNCISQPFNIILRVTRPIPILSAINKSTCSGISVDITPKGMPSGIQYRWDIPNGNGRLFGGAASNGYQSAILLSLTNRSLLADSIQYTIEPNLDNCNGNPFTATIRVLPLPAIQTSAANYICRNVNDSIKITFTTGTAPFSIRYSDNGTLGSRNNIQTNPYTLNLPPAGNGVIDRLIIFSQISDSACTSNTDTSIVYQEVKKLPSGKILSLHGTYICNGIPDTLHVLTADSVGYQWKLNGVNLPGQTSDSLFTTLPGYYQATLTDGFGCADTTTNAIRLIVSKPPVIKFKQDIRCIDSLVTFTNQTDSLISGPLTWKWDFGNGFTSNQYHAQTKYQVSGSYHVIVAAQQQNCGAFPPTILDSVIQIAAPIPGVDSINVKAYKNKDISISARYIPGYRYAWKTVTGTTEGLRNPNTYETIFNFGQSVRYNIKLTSPEGCITNDSMWVRVFNEDVIDVFVPKAFTPNNDQRNDKIFPYLTPGVKRFVEFNIFSRMGNRVFHTEDYSTGWDGRVFGVDQPIGIYFWEVIYYDQNDKKTIKYGQFLLSR